MLQRLNSIIKADIPVHLQKVVPSLALPKSEYVIERPPYRNPSNYTVNVSVVVCDLNAHIDIDLRLFTYYVSKEMSVGGECDKNRTPFIIDIQHYRESFGDRDLFVEKKTKKQTEQFNNQCTMRVALRTHPSNKIVYVKLFNNGSLHFTGVTSLDDTVTCANIISEKISYLSKYSKINEQIYDLRTFGITGSPSLTKKYQSTLKYLETNKACTDSFIIFDRVLKTKSIVGNIVSMIPQKDLIRLRGVNTFFSKLLGKENDEFWSYCLRTHRKEMYIKMFNYDGYALVKSNIISSRKPQILNGKCLKKIYLSKRENLNYIPNYIVYSKDKTLKMSNQTVEMINSSYSLNFYINQRKFTKIVKEKYPYINCSYEPDDRYHGVKLYWNHPDGVTVFISVFRTGGIIMSGAKTFNELGKNRTRIYTLIFSLTFYFVKCNKHR